MYKKNEQSIQRTAAWHGALHCVRDSNDSPQQRGTSSEDYK